MWLLLFNAWAADPPPATSTPAADPLRATCPSGTQRCGDTCTPWSEPCAAAVSSGLSAVERAEHLEQVSATVCGKRLTEPGSPEVSAAATIVYESARSAVCMRRAHGEDPACDPLADQPRASVVATDRSPCGDPPVVPPAPPIVVEPPPAAAAPKR